MHLLAKMFKKLRDYSNLFIQCIQIIPMQNGTTIRISRKTKQLLDEIGRKPESYDVIVKKSAEYYKKHNRVRR